VQTLSRGRFARYWVVAYGEEGKDGGSDEDEVNDDGNDDSNVDSNVDSNGNEGLKGQLAEYERQAEEEEKAIRQLVDSRVGVNFESTWVREMKWKVHLGATDLMEHFNASRRSISAAAVAKLRGEAERAEQEQLARVGESFDREMERCMGRMDQVPYEVLRWLASVDPSKPAGKGFEVKQEEETMGRYRDYWKRYLCYCVRACRLGRREARERRRIRFTDEQWNPLTGIVSLLDEEGDSIGGDGGRRREGSSSNNSRSRRGRIRRRDSNNGNIDNDGPTEREAALDRVVFAFCVTSLKQKVTIKPFTNPLLHFTVVLGIDGVRKAWKQARDYTGQLAGLIWCARILMLEDIFGGEQLEEREDSMEMDEEEDNNDESDEESNPETMGFEAIDHFLVQHREWLADGSFSPFSYMIRIMAYGKGHRKKEGGLARVMWEEDSKALRYLGERISVSKFRAAAYSYVREVEERMDKLTWGRWAVLAESLALGLIKDSLVFEGPGHSFATNEGNRWLGPGWRRLSDIITAGGGGSGKGGGGGKGGGKGFWDEKMGRWRARPIKAWLGELHQFKEALLAATHVWGGQPGRGPEIMTIRHCDTQDMARNVFVFDGQVMLVTDRDKTKAIRGIGRKVARFLPDRLGRVMAAYVLWLLPFEKMICAVSGAAGPAAALGPWLWKDGRKGLWQTAELSKKLTRVTTEHIGVGLGVADYRHVTIELGRQIRGLIVQQLEVDMTEEADWDNGRSYEDPMTGEAREQKRVEYVWDVQATHGSAIARQHYALNIQFPDQLQPQMVANFREISRLWHRYLEYEDEAGAEPGGSHQKTMTTTPTPMPLSSSSSWLSSNVGRKRSWIESSASGPPEPSGLPLVLSSPSARGIRGAAATATTVTPKRRTGLAAPVETRGYIDDSAAKRRRTAEGIVTLHSRLSAGGGGGGSAARVNAGLRALLGANAGWRSAEQEEAMKRIMTLRGGSVLIVVLPTGGGKSILFMLPALPSTNGGVSIVVVPFVALMEDLASRAREFGIDCLKWLPAAETGRDERQRIARLVVVSADQVESSEFRAYADGLRARGVFKRIFVDECHTIIMDAGYRGRLAGLKGLYRYECPVVLLTATLPVRLERWFRRMMLAQDGAMIRASTMKKNIRYRVVQVKPGRPGQSSSSSASASAVEDEVVRRVVSLTAGMQGDEKGVLYCRSKAKCEQMAEKIGASHYHSDVEAEKRQEALSMWAEGRSATRWIVATTGLGTGVDIKGIVAVVHVEQPYGLVDFVQQTGRGGRRDGEVVESVIVVDGRPAYYDRHGSDVDQANRQAMERFMGSTECRRIGLGLFMDGLAQDCEGAGAEYCDRCRELVTVREDEVEGEVEGENSSGSSPIDDDLHRSVGGGSSARLQRDNAEAQAREQQLRGWLDEVEGKCAVCYVIWCHRGRKERRQEMYNHELRDCRTMEKAGYLAWRRQVTFRDYVCCWRCGLPQSWCRAEAEGYEGSGCRSTDKMFPIVKLATMDRRLHQAIRDEFEVEATDEKEFISWLGRVCCIEGGQSTNALAVWELVIRRECLDTEAYITARR
jgi:superfamily II DNA helicase RecQ